MALSKNQVLTRPQRSILGYMCNLYSNTMAKDAMRQLFAVDAGHDDLGNAEPLTAIFPKGLSPIVGANADGTRWLQTAHWGFVMPQVSKKTGKPIRPKAVNNARDDKLRTLRFWTKSFEEWRCDERQPSWPVPTTTLAGGAERRTGMPVRRAAPPA
ncbi:SOS response associated peptidase (SRAP) [Loktanella atrilutea]|uniref:SOS response associated peptidase (SRAP) n=1 Tax=Loktanella atrilutea TaxID=366533 RepID=A0A1M5F9X2_LOKAT|nr:SOS response-associated peptidase family protein [Loktanella atrilutea]SHF88317.1 SOS response associated peptidase (SRAP) [Loktanella atrilutea]